MFDGFITVATATPALRLADTDYNVKKCIELAESASNEGVKVLVFPELFLSGSTSGVLFFSDTLLHSAKRELLRVLDSTCDTDTIIIIGFLILNQTCIPRRKATWCIIILI